MGSGIGSGSSGAGMLAVAVVIVPVGVFLSLLGIPAVRKVLTQHIETLREHFFGPTQHDQPGAAETAQPIAKPAISDDFDSSVFTKVFTTPRPSSNHNEAAP